MVSGYVPEAGDIVWLDFDPHAGREQGGRRPAVVVSARSYNSRSGLVLACPITSKVKGYPFEVGLRGTEVTGVALADHIKSFDYSARRLEFAERAPSDLLEQIRALLIALIDPV